MRPLIFRFRVLLKFHRAVTLHPHHAGVLYAVVAEANGLALNIPPAIPDGMMVQAVEQCRCQIAPFETYAFGITIISDSVENALTRVRLLRRGLVELSQKAPHGRAVFCGNFTLKEISDLVSDRKLYDETPPTPIAAEDLVAEVDRLHDIPRIAIRFITPLRMSRSKHHKEGQRHHFFDRRSFDPHIFLRRVRGRLVKLGFLDEVPPVPESVTAASELQLIENQLVWLDVVYGGRDNHTKLGGALGEVTLTGCNRQDLETLVWGQYVGVGENTRFGHGLYRIPQLGGDPYACPRSVSLRELAFGPQFLDTAAERYDLEPGRAGELLRAVRAGNYVPSPPFPVMLRSGSKERLLAIPAREDRTLQRAVLDSLGPALDKLFEASSLAYRRGMGRHDAPRRLQEAFADGYRWALKADFCDFFDSVPHDELQQRLHAYLADPPLVGLLMAWVRCGSPLPNQGLPTGAVVSPLLANLFLDEFDEQLGGTDARLVRYADDFVILFRDRAAADSVYATAEAAAEELRLTLNSEKTSFVNLTEPFQWLGFRFWIDDEWQKSALGTPVSMNSLI